MLQTTSKRHPQFWNTALHFMWSSAAPAAQPWPRYPTAAKRPKQCIHVAENIANTSKTAERSMEIKENLAFCCLLALWTSKIDPKRQNVPQMAPQRTQMEPNGRQKGPKGAQREPKGIQRSLNGIQMEPKREPKEAQRPPWGPKNIWKEIEN